MHMRSGPFAYVEHPTEAHAGTLNTPFAVRCKQPSPQCVWLLPSGVLIQNTQPRHTPAPAPHLHGTLRSFVMCALNSSCSS